MKGDRVSSVVCVFALTPSHEIYLVSQYRNLYNKVTLEAPSGFVGSGESVLKTAMRQLRKKTGIVASHWEEIARVDLGGSVIKSVVHIFLARDLEKVKAVQKNKDIPVVTMSLQDAVGKVIRREISGCITGYGIFVLDALKKERKL